MNKIKVITKQLRFSVNMTKVKYENYYDIEENYYNAEDWFISPNEQYLVIVKDNKREYIPTSIILSIKEL